MKRYECLDDIRGITLLSMILFHATWDLVYMFRVDWDWFYTDFAFWWQQSICWTFILLSGFCWSLGRRKLRRGLEVFGGGLLITVVTVLLMPGQRIVFGILTFLGVAMLLLIPLEKWLKKIPGKAGLVISFVMFLLCYGINDGCLGMESVLELYHFPEVLYDMGNVATFIGFTDKHFYSADYFSLLPWIFLFITGYFLYRVFEGCGVLGKMAQQKSLGRLWNLLGKNSLFIYMLHQPVVYGVLVLLDICGVL